jgi:hypothetical protein
METNGAGVSPTCGPSRLPKVDLVDRHTNRSIGKMSAGINLHGGPKQSGVLRASRGNLILLPLVAQHFYLHTAAQIFRPTALAG